MHTLIITTLALIAGICIGLAIGEFRKQDARIAALEAADQKKRLPYHTADEIENATAALLRIKFETDFRQELCDNALSHLQAARNGNGKDK